jgi:glyceraldehyde-3-phosphate dehydrogenase/erythrose-4-phosphate dehydrogenase
MTRIGINGFGRIGRLATRALREHPELQLVHINEYKGGPATAAHLLEFDSVHGRYGGTVAVERDRLSIDGSPVSFSEHSTTGTAETVDSNACHRRGVRSASASTARPAPSHGATMASTS